MTTETSTTAEAAAVAEQAAPVAPKQAPSTKGKNDAPKGRKAAKKAAAKKDAKPAGKNPAKKQAKPASKKAATKEAPVPREFSKKAIVIDLMRRKDGATLAEIAKATDWQSHSIRGFISGSLTKKMGLNVESLKRQDGERSYKVAQ